MFFLTSPFSNIYPSVFLTNSPLAINPVLGEGGRTVSQDVQSVRRSSRRTVSWKDGQVEGPGRRTVRQKDGQAGGRSGRTVWRKDGQVEGRSGRFVMQKDGQVGLSCRRMAVHAGLSGGRTVR